MYLCLSRFKTIYIINYLTDSIKEKAGKLSEPCWEFSDYKRLHVYMQKDWESMFLDYKKHRKEYYGVTEFNGFWASQTICTNLCKNAASDVGTFVMKVILESFSPYRKD